MRCVSTHACFIFLQLDSSNFSGKKHAQSRRICRSAALPHTSCDCVIAVGAINMATNDSKAPLRTVKKVQFGILSPDEIVSISFRSLYTSLDYICNSKDSVLVGVNSVLMFWCSANMADVCILMFTEVKKILCKCISLNNNHDL